MKNASVFPVILGDGAGAVAAALSFYQTFGIRSRIIGRRPLCRRLSQRIAKVRVFPELTTDHAGVGALLASSSRSGGEGSLLIPTDKETTDFSVRNERVLSSGYRLLLPKPDLYSRLSDPVRFCTLLDLYGIPFGDSGAGKSGPGGDHRSRLFVLSDASCEVRVAVLADVLFDGPFGSVHGMARLLRPLDGISYALIRLCDRIAFSGVCSFDLLYRGGEPAVCGVSPTLGEDADVLRAAGISLARFYVSAAVGQKIPEQLRYAPVYWRNMRDRAVLSSTLAPDLAGTVRERLCDGFAFRDRPSRYPKPDSGELPPRREGDRAYRLKPRVASLANFPRTRE